MNTPVAYEPWQILEAVASNQELLNATTNLAAQFEVARHRGELDWPEDHPNHPDYTEPEEEEDGDTDA